MPAESRPVYVGATIRWDYGERRPFRDTWDDLSLDARKRALPYWICKAGRDPWAFRELLALAARLEEADEDKPEHLRAFMLAYLRGETEPPKGWKSDPTEDARIAALVHIMGELGILQRDAFRTIAETMNKSPKTVESARRRGLKI